MDAPLLAPRQPARSWLKRAVDEERDAAAAASCRICLESGGDLISPCMCKGTQQFVHRCCLDHWRSVREGTAFSHCTTCKAQFHLRVQFLEGDGGRKMRFRLFVARDILLVFLAIQTVTVAIGGAVYLLDKDGHFRNRFADEEAHDLLGNESEALAVERSGQRRPAAAPPRKKHQKGDKRPRKTEKIEGVMERYIEMRQKQSEDETALWAREMEARERENAQVSDFSIRRCFSVLNTMEMTKEEKAKACSFFTKNKDNREAFICACELDEEAALIWLRSEMA